MSGRCDGRMALIIVERKRRVFRSSLHILRLRGRRRHMMLVRSGKMLLTD
jgi:hypothetical protein